MASCVCQGPLTRQLESGWPDGAAIYARLKQLPEACLGKQLTVHWSRLSVVHSRIRVTVSMKDARLRVASQRSSRTSCYLAWLDITCYQFALRVVPPG